MMGQESIKRPNHKVSTGAFVIGLICFVMCLILFGIAIACLVAAFC
jgi:hypothetical protein